MFSLKGMDEQGKPGAGEMDSLRRQVANLEERLEESHRDRDAARHLLAEEARHREQLESELRRLNQWADPRQTEVTARLFGDQPLRARLPDLFQELVGRYGNLLEQALEQRNFRVDHQVSESLRTIADQMGHLRCGPRDVVDLHHATLRAKMAAITPGKALALGAEGRYVVLELMGSLVSYYRNRSLVSNGPPAPPGAALPRAATDDKPS